MKDKNIGTTVPQNKENTPATHVIIEEHAEAIWHTTELLRNQQSADGDKVTIAKGALQMCCETIDSKLSDIVEVMESIT